MSDSIFKVTINGKDIECKPHETILQVAKRGNVYIPTLCHDDRLEPYGGCRLCIVDVKNAPRPLPACTTPVENNMIVTTETDALRKIRANIVDLLLSNHPNDCMRCEATGDCTLQDLSYEYNVKGARFYGKKWNLPIREDNPFITFEPNKCILCGRCTRICNEVVMAGTIQITGRGFNAVPETAFKNPRTLDNCEFCGQCVSTCPTGALTDKKTRGMGRSYELKKVRTTCSYCGTGCNFDLNVKDGKVVKVTSALDAPVNQGNLCVKGRYGYDFIHSFERIKEPLIRKGDRMHAVSWDEALDYVADNFKKIIKKHGNNSVGGFSSSRCTNEENFLLAKFVRTVFKSNNVDNCARV